MTDLLETSDPGRYRLVRWSGKAGDDPASTDLTALVLGLARDLSPPDMAEQLAVLGRALEGHGTAGLEGFMARTVDTMLELRDYPGRFTKEGATAMAEVMDRFRQGMEELVQKGRREGRQQGQALVLRRQVTRRFGEETAGRMSRLLDEPPRPEDVDRVTDAMVECATGDEFIERVRMG